MHTMTHRWWGSLSFIGEMRTGDANGAAYITPDPIYCATQSERGARLWVSHRVCLLMQVALVTPFLTRSPRCLMVLRLANNAHSNMDAKLHDYSEGAITAGWYDGNHLGDGSDLRLRLALYLLRGVFRPAPDQDLARQPQVSAVSGMKVANSLGVWTNDRWSAEIISLLSVTREPPLVTPISARSPSLRQTTHLPWLGHPMSLLQRARVLRTMRVTSCEM